jgi:heme-degrading monooxygenase HmoA
VAGVHHRERQGGPRFRLGTALRDADDSRHFLSFSDWADAASRGAWKASPEFERGLTSCRELCDEFAGADSAQVASF